MRKIPLTQGKFALIDDEDYPIVSLFKWYANKHRYTFYAIAKINLEDGKRTAIKMHRLILNAKPNEMTDHSDRNGLNNQRHNLRKCTNSQNQMNSKSYIGSSKYKGVSWDKTGKRWRTRITLNRKSIYLGFFKKELEAAWAYNDATIKHFKGFARPNEG